LKIYRLLGADGATIESLTPGLLGGNRKARIYGRLSCASAVRALARGYARHRVFFADESSAIAAGYRPCGACMKPQYAKWKSELAKERL
jgi:methylphosphotriester-DNA--protein-cysteine methyltransferase